MVRSTPVLLPTVFFVFSLIENHTEFFDLLAGGILVQDSQDDFLTVDGGQGGDAHVHHAGGGFHGYPPVLGTPPLGDIQFTHDLDARDHERRQRATGLEHFAKNAVDTEAYAQPVLVRFNVHVGRVVLDGFGQDRVDETNDRRIVIALEQVGRFLQLLRDAKASGVLVEEVTWARLGQITGGAVHQGIVLQPAAAETLDLASLIEGCGAVGESPLLIAVDGLTVAVGERGHVLLSDDDGASWRQAPSAGAVKVLPPAETRALVGAAEPLTMPGDRISLLFGPRGWAIGGTSSEVNVLVNQRPDRNGVVRIDRGLLAGKNLGADKGSAVDKDSAAGKGLAGSGDRVERLWE